MSFPRISTVSRIGELAPGDAEVMLTSANMVVLGQDAIDWSAVDVDGLPASADSPRIISLGSLLAHLDQANTVSTDESPAPVRVDAESSVVMMSEHETRPLVAQNEGVIVDATGLDVRDDTVSDSIIRLFEAGNAAINFVIDTDPIVAEEDKIGSRIVIQRLGNASTNGVITQSEDGFEGIVSSLPEIHALLDYAPYSDGTLVEISELVERGDHKALASLLGPRFDELLPSTDHNEVIDLFEEDELSARQLVEQLIVENYPQFRDMPHLVARLAGKYVDFGIASLMHLADTVSEESQLRAEKSGRPRAEHIEEVLYEQATLKSVFKKYEEHMRGRSRRDVVDEEYHLSKADLDQAEATIRSRAHLYDVDPDGINMEEQFELQAYFWDLLTSSTVTSVPYVNYRKVMNDTPGSFRKLFPHVTYDPRMAASALHETIPFVIPASSTDYGRFSTGLGFLHLTLQDPDGPTYRYEVPVSMYDPQLFEQEPELVQEILDDLDDFAFNHDLWHNQVPVFDHKFIQHHPYSPISYGGRFGAYEEFGAAKIVDPEEYERSVAMSHLRTKQERFESDPSYYHEEAGRIRSAMAKVVELRDRLGVDEAARHSMEIVDYLATRVLVRAYNIFERDDPLFAELEPVYDQLGVADAEVHAGDVLRIAASQGLIDLGLATSILEHSGNAEQATSTDEIALMLKEMTDHNVAAHILRSALMNDPEQRDSGAEFVYRAFQDLGFSDIEDQSITLHGMAKVRWMALISPQKEAMKGIMEKVHGKQAINYGSEQLDDPRDLVILQHKALSEHRDEYARRLLVRLENQRVSAKAYDMIFEEEVSAGRTLTELASSDDTGLAEAAKEWIGFFDLIMHELVEGRFGDVREQAGELLSSEGSTSLLQPEMHRRIKILVGEYENMRLLELAHQSETGTTYREEKGRLISQLPSHMSIKERSDTTEHVAMDQTSRPVADGGKDRSPGESWRDVSIVDSFSDIGLQEVTRLLEPLEGLLIEHAVEDLDIDPEDEAYIRRAVGLVREELSALGASAEPRVLLTFYRSILHRFRDRLMDDYINLDPEVDEILGDAMIEFAVLHHSPGERALEEAVKTLEKLGGPEVFRDEILSNLSGWSLTGAYVIRQFGIAAKHFLGEQER